MALPQKHRRPANDPKPQLGARGIHVSVSASYWTVKRLVAASLLGLFVLLLGVSLGVLVPTTEQPVSAVQKTEINKQADQVSSAKPFDIVINENELTQPLDDVNAVAEKLPTIVIRPRDAKQASSLEQAMELVVASTEVSNVKKAEQFAQSAQKLAEKGNLDSALRYQQRAVELAPDNMAYRLNLAVFCDHARDVGAAIGLYQQIVAAYENDDETLPDDLDIDAIHQRLTYLQLMASK